MKKLVLLILFAGTSYLSAQSFDLEYIDQSVDLNFRAIHFVNENIGFAGSFWGSIIKTSDSGYSWDSTNLVNDAPIYEIQFISELIGFAVGGSPNCSPNPCSPPGSVFLKTTDGGINWTKTTIDDKALYTLYFLNADTGFVAGFGNLYRTTDSGSTWDSISLNSFYNITKIQFVNGVGFLSANNAGTGGNIIKSIDGGLTWSLLNTGVNNLGIRSLDFIDENTGYAAGSNGIIKTTDGGTTWHLLPLTEFLNSVNTLSANHVIASGWGKTVNAYTYGGIYESLDGGNTWVANDSLSLMSYAYSFFISDYLGFAVGIDSKILRLFKDNPNTSTNLISSNFEDFLYPNPVDSKIYLNNTRYKHIKLIDNTGKEVLSQEIIANNINIAFLESGVYFYQLSNGKYVQYGKLIKK
jgi:photosystem II stability/assembly factor-like uncharacterized protein